MANNNSIGPRIVVEGEKEFKNSMAAIKSEFKQLDSEMKLTVSQFEKNDKSIEALTAKNKVLGKEIDSQKTRISILSTQYENHNKALAEAAKKLEEAKKAHADDTTEVIRAQKEYDTHANKVRNFQSEINTATAKLNLMDAALADNNKSIATQSSQWTKLGDKLDATGTKFKSVGDGMANVGQSATIGLTMPLLAAGGLAFKYASDLEENMNKSNVAFGDNAGEVEKWSETTLESYGISQSSALDMASMFGDMSTSMGMSTVEAAKMSTSIAGLAGDLASFKNIGIDQAQTALKGIWTGEGEALKTLGIIMQDSTLIAYAQAQGIEKSYSEMTQAEKVALRYSYVMDSTANSQGDFSATSDGAANSSRTFSESIKEMGASFGKELLPIITPVIQNLTEVTKEFGNLDSQTKKNIVTTLGVVAVVGPLLLVAGTLTKALGGVLTVAGTVSGAISVMTVGATAATPAVAGLAGAMTFLTGPVGLVALAVTGVTVGLGALYISQQNNTAMTKEQIAANETFVASATDTIQSINDGIAARKTSLEASELEIISAQTLSEKIFDLSEKQNKSATELSLLNVLISEFNQVMPTAKLAIDDQTGALNLTKTAVDDLITVEKERILLLASSEMLIANKKAEMEATLSLGDASEELNRLEKEKSDAAALAIEQGGTSVQMTERVQKATKGYNDKIAEAKGLVGDLTTSQALLVTEGNNINEMMKDPSGFAAKQANQQADIIATTTYTGTDLEIMEQHRLNLETNGTNTGNGYSNNLSNAFINNRGTVEQESKNSSDAVKRGFSSTAQNAWEESDKANKNIKDTFINNRGEIETNAGQTSTSIKNMLLPLGQFGTDTGVNLNSGLKTGMTDVPGIEAVTGGIVALVKRKFLQGFDINSPSKFTHGVGTNILVGLFNGLSSMNLGAFANNMVGNLLDAFRNGKTSALKLLQLMGTQGQELLNRMGIKLPTIGNFISPTDSANITSEFGNRDSPGGIGSTNHQGIDIGAAYGDAVRAAAEGIVTFAGDAGGYGNMVRINHGDGLETIYAHLSEILVNVGQQVSAGTNIGEVGSTGNSTGPHLHYGVYQDGTAIDPMTAGVGASSSGGNVGDWIRQAMAATGVSASNYEHLYQLVMNESGGDPNAINNWDSNAMAGTPSKGLMQTIQSTFDAYSMGGSIWDPVANSIAAIRYMLDRYGSIGNTPLGGYAMGTNYATPGVHLVGELGPEFINFRGGETVTTARDTASIINNSQTARQPAVINLVLQNGTKLAEYLIDDINNMLGAKTGLAGRGQA